MAEYWGNPGNEPLLIGALLAVSFAYVVQVVASLVYDRAVPGSRNSYVSSTVMRTLCLPLFGAYVFQAGLDIITSDWFWLILHAFICYTLHWDWNRLKDSDDWWKGKGTKLKKKLRSMFSTISPAAAGAGA